VVKSGPEFLSISKIVYFEFEQAPTELLLPIARKSAQKG
jgi:hypothetical protein